MEDGEISFESVAVLKVKDIRKDWSGIKNRWLRWQRCGNTSKEMERRRNIKDPCELRGRKYFSLKWKIQNQVNNLLKYEPFSEMRRA